MRMIVHLELEVKIEKDRTNANEVLLATEEALREAEGQVVQKVVEAYQVQAVSTLCRASGRNWASWPADCVDNARQTGLSAGEGV